MKELCFDISTWQGGINYNEIRKRTNYVILRAGFDITKDNRFEEHYNNLQGLHLGAYWYSYAQSTEQARAEARKCLEVINGKKFDLPIYLDMEDPSIAGLSSATLDAIVRAFGEEIEKAGYYFGVYCNLNWYNNKLSGSELNKRFDWWIAYWSDDAPDPAYGINNGIWQFTSKYNLDGYIIDADYIFKDYPTIIRKLGLNHLDPIPTPEPTPTPDPKPISDDELLDLVRKTIRGDFGNGQDRVDALKDLYDLVQNQVNLNIDNGLTNWDNIRLFK